MQSLLMLLFFATAINVQADERSLFVFDGETTNSKKVVLDLSTLDAHTVSCRIMNDQGRLIFTDEFLVGAGGYKKFNLENLDDGRYSFRLNDLMQVIKYDILIKGNEINVLENKETIFKPTVWLNEDKTVDFHLLSQGKNVNIELFNNRGELIYQKRLKDQWIVSKRLNMKDVIKGEYTMKVSVGNETFFKYLNV